MITDILAAAGKAVADRQKTYGSPTDNHTRTALMWSAYLGVEILPHQVPQMNSLQKISRSCCDATHIDNYTDQAGFAQNAATVVTETLLKEINRSTGPVTPSTDATGAIVSETQEKLSEAYMFP